MLVSSFAVHWCFFCYQFLNLNSVHILEIFLYVFVFASTQPQNKSQVKLKLKLKSCDFETQEETTYKCLQVFANIIEFWGAPDRLLFRAKNVNNLKISIFFYHPSTLFSAPTRTKNTLFGFHREDECSSWKYAFNKRKQKRANRYKSKRLNIYNTNMNATNGVHIFVIVLFIYTRRKKNRRDAKDAAVV